MKADLGNIIHQLRTSRNHSQEVMASKLNVSRQAISKWENNMSAPDLVTLQIIAEVYGIQISYFTEENVKTDNKIDSKIRSVFFSDTFLYRIIIGFISILSVVFFGVFSLFVTTPNLILNVRKKKIFWIAFYIFLVGVGFYILMTILFPGLMPYSIDVKIG